MSLFSFSVHCLSLVKSSAQPDRPERVLRRREAEDVSVYAPIIGTRGQKCQCFFTILCKRGEFIWKSVTLISIKES